MKKTKVVDQVSIPTSTSIENDEPNESNFLFNHLSYFLSFFLSRPLYKAKVSAVVVRFQGTVVTLSDAWGKRSYLSTTPARHINR